MFNTICWNCRGARKKEVGNYLRHLIGAHDVSVVGLVETKIEVFSRTDVDRIVGRDWDFCYQPSVGKACGILVLWKCSMGSFQVIFKSKQCIMGRFRSSSSFDWEVAVVNADKDAHIRAMAFNEISQHHVSDSPLIVGGDFNCILAQADKKGFSSSAFTWTNNKDAGSRISSRLDRFLISSSILDAFQELRVSHLSRIASDHCPILCTAESLRYKVQLLNSTLGRLSTWWRQRAKVKWIEEGDDNTRFFHSMASARRRTNLIDWMRLPDGQMVSEQADILQAVKEFFDNKWRGMPICEDAWPSFEAQNTTLAPVTTLLDKAVTEEEIWNGVRDLGQNRAPGRDGVTASFFKSFWSIVGK
ncbi:uncharacterized protein LOC114579202 [Dendrobium catenatum]|uniref:uncharacterized protein LOC114579202 n=1 Tax=Dendrobium catenatum TaxID=906689 RepID=UPI00109F55B2|nr:uncharacterized protein LOC114579202 [Dendrobium catenatum]